MKKIGFKITLPYLILFLGGMVLLAKCFYSFCWSDETFYFSTAYRFYQGDSIFLHDWFPTQLSGVLLLPFLALFIGITGSTSGIILYFRILYVIFSLLCSITVYQVLKKDKNTTVGLIAAVCSLFYAHLNIATLSYYTISVQCFLIAMILLYHFGCTRKNSLLIYAGIIFAIAVLALPTLAIAWVLALFAVAIMLIVSRTKISSDTYKLAVAKTDYPRIILYTSIGIIIPAVIFFIFLFNNVSITDFIKGIPYVLSDEEHGTGLIYPLRKFFISINQEYGNKGAYLGYLLILGSLIFQQKLRKRPYCLIVFGCDAALFVYYAVKSFNHTGYIQTAICMFCLPLFFLTVKKDLNAFFTIFLGGMIFSFVYSYSSNGYLYIISLGHAISSVAAIIFISDFTNEHLLSASQDRSSLTIARLITIVSAIVLCYVMTTTVILRIRNIYRDAPLPDLTSKISCGPASGLFTTEEHARLYNEVYETITDYCQSNNLSGQESGTIFITKLLPFGYMCTDLKCAAPTSWRTQFNSERLEPYYDMNPDRVPDMVLVLDKEYGCYDTCGDVEADPSPNENEIGGFLLSYINSHNYSVIDVPCGTLYKAN